MSTYEDRIWCDVLDIDVVDILLSRPWLYELDVTSLDRSNTYEFKFNEKKIMSKHVKPKSNVRNIKEGIVSDKNNKSPRYLVTRSHFSPESPIDGFTPN